jgi:hypothetical protein
MALDSLVGPAKKNNVVKKSPLKGGLTLAQISKKSLEYIFLRWIVCMVIRVVEFSSGDYKIRKIFG